MSYHNEQTITACSNLECVEGFIFLRSFGTPKENGKVVSLGITKLL